MKYPKKRLFEVLNHLKILSKFYILELNKVILSCNQTVTGNQLHVGVYYNVGKLLIQKKNKLTLCHNKLYNG